jgi:hypothetical protein
MANTRFPAQAARDPRGPPDHSVFSAGDRNSLLGVPDAKSPARKDLRHAFNAVEGVILNFLITIREGLLPLLL